MSFSTIIAMMEEADKVKIFASSSWKKIETAQPKLAKDFKLYLDKDKFKDFIELANQVIEANQKNKTNAMFPKLDKDTWQNILKVVEYLRKEDPRLKSGAKLSNDVWWHEKVVREAIVESLELIEQSIIELCEGYRAYDSSHEGEYVMVLVMGDEAAEQAEKDGKEYYGVNVCFYVDGKVDAECADKYAEAEWKKDKQKIIDVARPKADRLLKEESIFEAQSPEQQLAALQKRLDAKQAAYNDHKAKYDEKNKNIKSEAGYRAVQRMQPKLSSLKKDIDAINAQIADIKKNGSKTPAGALSSIDRRIQSIKDKIDRFDDSIRDQERKMDAAREDQTRWPHGSAKYAAAHARYYAAYEARSLIRTRLENAKGELERLEDQKAKQKPISEGKNHLGETTYSSWGAWRAACKKIAPDVWYDGDKDIANAMVGPKPYVRNKTKSIGEWDGETGTVYKDAAETAASVVTEAALPIHAKLLNGDEVEMHKVDVYMNKKDGAILYLINGKTMSQYKATGKNLHADDVEML